MDTYGEQGDERRLSISEMAHIHSLTRTTLIYYDKIGLFEPMEVDEKGYRYYATEQIPFLREICFLRSIGVSLDEIKAHNEHLSSQYTMNLLEHQLETLDKELQEIGRKKSLIEQRVCRYQRATEYATDDYKPTIEYFPERYAIYWPWEKEEKLTSPILNRSLAKAWGVMGQYDILPGQHWGSMLRQCDLNTDDPLAGAMVYSLLPEEVEKNLGKFSAMKHFKVIPAGYYACIYKFAMPFQMEDTWKLIRWVESQGYEITGDLVDVCLLDIRFYKEQEETDFCQLQIPIDYEPPEEN